MKYKLMGLTAAVLLLLTAAVFTYYRLPEKHARVHQHLTARRDTGCDCGGTELCSHLPLVIIDTGGQEIPGRPTGETDRFGESINTMARDGTPVILTDVRVIDNQDSNNHPTNTPAFTTACQLRVRGHTSRRYPKSPYLLNFVDNAGEDRSIPVMGMGAHHEWALHGPILDKSLVRNYMWYNISGEIMEYAPNCRYCELVMDEEYQGLYLMVETITAGDNCRLKLKMSTKGTSAVSYLFRCDRPQESDLETPRNIYSYAERAGKIYEDISIRYPGRSTLTPELSEAIELDYARFEKSLYSFDYDDSRYGYQNWIDAENFAEYYIINEFTKNVDAGRYSTYLYKELGEPYRLCVWDFNNACDNYPQDQVRPDVSFELTEQSWYEMLMRNDDFVLLIIDRYRALRDTYLSDEYLMRYIDETLEFLGPAAERNNRRWAQEIAGWDELSPDERNLHSHEEAVKQLKDWLLASGKWMDENIHALRQLCHYSRNKLYHHEQETD